MIKYQLFINEKELDELFVKSSIWKIHWLNLKNGNKEKDIPKVLKKHDLGSNYIFFKYDDGQLLPFYAGSSEFFLDRWQQHKKNYGQKIDFILLIYSEKFNEANIRKYYENQFIKALEEYQLDIECENKQINKLRTLSLEEKKSEEKDLQSLKLLINIVIPSQFFIQKENEKMFDKFNEINIKQTEDNDKYFYINRKIKNNNYICAKSIYDFDNKIIKILKDSWISKEIYSTKQYELILKKIQKLEKNNVLKHQLQNIKRRKNIFLKLIDKKIFVLNNEKYIFIKDFEFKPTEATNFLFGYTCGNNLDSRNYWKNNKGIKLINYLKK